MAIVNNKNYSKFQNLTLLFLRIVVALVFLFAGYAKWSFWSDVPEGIPVSMLNLLKFLSIVEPLGAVALILGFLTFWAATGLVAIMVGAILVLHFTMQVVFFTFPQSIGFDYNLLILSCCLVLISFGPGDWSVDKISKKS